MNSTHNDPPLRVRAETDVTLLLLESLIHGLIAAGTITVEAAIGIVMTAIDVQRDATLERGGDHLAVARAVRPLAAIENTLRTEKPKGES